MGPCKPDDSWQLEEMCGGKIPLSSPVAPVSSLVLITASSVVRLLF